MYNEGTRKGRWPPVLHVYNSHRRAPATVCFPTADRRGSTIVLLSLRHEVTNIASKDVREAIRPELVVRSHLHLPLLSLQSRCFSVMLIPYSPPLRRHPHHPPPPPCTVQVCCSSAIPLPTTLWPLVHSRPSQPAEASASLMWGSSR